MKLLSLRGLFWLAVIAAVVFFWGLVVSLFSGAHSASGPARAPAAASASSAASGSRG